MAFDIKLIFIFIFSNVFVHMNSCQMPKAKKNTFYTYKMQRCLPQEELLFETTEKNRGMCFTRCHNVENCQSVAFNARTHACRGYNSCPHSCSPDTNGKDWISYCEDGKISAFFLLLQSTCKVHNCHIYD